MDRATDDDVIGSGGYRFGRGHDSFLIAEFRAGRAYARCDNEMAFGFRKRTNQPGLLG